MSHWNVTYPKDQYSSGTYEVQVEIYRWTLFFWNIGSKRLYFELTREYSQINDILREVKQNFTVYFSTTVDSINLAVYYSHPLVQHFQYLCTTYD